MSANSPSNDPLAPTSRCGEGQAGPLACVTLITRKPAPLDTFYGAVLEMEKTTGTTATAARSAQRQVWGLPDDFDWEETVYCRPQLPEVPLLRVLASDQAGTTVRPGMASRLEGGAVRRIRHA